MTARFWILIVLLVAGVAAVVVAIPRLEGTPPVVGDVEPMVLGREPRALTLEVSDEGSGLRAVEVHLLAGGDPIPVVERHFPGSLQAGGDAVRESLEVTLDVSSLGVEDGEAGLLVVARDWSLRNGFAGNRSETRIPVRIDTRPPRLSVSSGLTYVYRGGSASVAYRVGEDTASDGVAVADAFFPGHPRLPADPRERIAIFAIPVDVPVEPPVRVVATDAAGNRSEAGFPVRIFERRFDDSSIVLSRSFLEGTVRPLAAAHDLERATLGESFRGINEELRDANERKIRELVRGGSPTRHWQGAFEQMRNSVVTSRFAERRSYVWEDSVVSKATHYGFDLASTSGAAVTASNAGVVAFAGDLGIYGGCVIIDHGLGVHSLYGHLSQIDVEVGESVAKGQALGRSGATGLAGGDHLHFAILVGGHYVDPLEWWDPKWVRSHVEVRLEPDAATDPAG